MQTALHFSIHVLDGSVFFQQKKQLSQGREILRVATSKIFLTTNTYSIWRGIK
jgi:hypothetical protein